MTDPSLPSITDAFVCVPDCPRCLGSGTVCEAHPDRAWDEGEGCCGAPGMPCNPALRQGPVYSEPDPMDFGHGVTGRFIGWDPDKDLNPQWAHLDAMDRYGLIWRHPRPDGTGECHSALTFDTPAAREVEPGKPKWIATSYRPLTLEPSILCSLEKGGCGLHGYIRQGRWEYA